MSERKYGGQDGSIEERSGHSLWGRIGYFFFWRLFYVAILIVFRFRVHGRENLPDGPFILSGVHRSFIDTPLIGMTTSRRMRFMGKEAMWDNRVMGAFLTAMGGFPVERGTADRTALRAAEDVLALGEPLVMFPEGTRKEGPRLRREDLLDGPAFVSARTGIPIVPVGIGGSARAMPLGSSIPRPIKCVAVIGEPIYPPDRGEGRMPRRVVTDLTDTLFEELGDLYIEARVLAGDEAAPGD
ncbi:MAG: lysophospholipid acyltransferase family protein [Acidimicrobiales bacterium]